MKISALISVLVLVLLFPAFARSERTDSLSTGRRAGITAVSATSSLLVNAAVTEAVKRTFHELRPDRNGNNSFPSRHTSWVFAASTVISNELYRKSPFWSLGAQALATSIGLQRVMIRRHYGSDVIGGAITGVLSTEVCYLAIGRFFGTGRTLSRSENDFRPCFSVETEALYFADRSVAAGFGIALRGDLPFSRRWGATAIARSWSAPSKTRACGVRPLKAVGLTAGVCGHFRLPCAYLAVESSLQAGGTYIRHTAGYCDSGAGFESDFDLGLNWRLTDSFAIRATAGYRVLTYPKTMTAVTIGVGSVAVF